MSGFGGRPRDVFALRYPSGRLHRRHKPPPRQHQPHRIEFGDNPLAATTHGRYLLRHQITAREHAAGEKYLRERLRYRAAIGAPDSLRSRFEGHYRDPDDQADQEIIQKHEQTRRLLGRLVHDVDWVVMLDAAFSDLTDYRAGLARLAGFYGI